MDVTEAEYPVRRPAGVSAGLTIYLPEGSAYRAAAQSRAFPGWTAEEIHTALEGGDAVSGDESGAAVRPVAGATLRGSGTKGRVGAFEGAHHRRPLQGAGVAAAAADLRQLGDRIGSGKDGLHP